MQIRIVTLTPGQNPPGKLAEAEVHFTEGPMAGHKLIGFAIWTSRYNDRLNVTFPARQYSVNGERRSFALVRPIDERPVYTLQEAIIRAYRDQVDGGERAALEQAG